MNDIKAIMGEEYELLIIGLITLSMSLAGVCGILVFNNPIETIFPLFVFIITMFMCGLLFLLKFIDCVLGDYEL